PASRGRHKSCIVQRSSSTPKWKAQCQLRPAAGAPAAWPRRRSPRRRLHRRRRLSGRPASALKNGGARRRRQQRRRQRKSAPILAVAQSDPRLQDGGVQQPSRRQFPTIGRGSGTAEDPNRVEYIGAVRKDSPRNLTISAATRTLCLAECSPAVWTSASPGRNDQGEYELRDGFSAEVFRAVLSFYTDGCLRGTDVSELRAACDYFMVPFTLDTMRKCEDLQGLLHEFSNDGARAQFEHFLEERAASAKCQIVILADEDVVDWDEDGIPQLCRTPEGAASHSELQFNVQILSSNNVSPSAVPCGSAGRRRRTGRVTLISQCVKSQEHLGSDQFRKLSQLHVRVDLPPSLTSVLLPDNIRLHRNRRVPAEGVLEEALERLQADQQQQQQQQAAPQQRS
uniref:BTB_3 domain-containing protein n=1 Tax=Macrostomum lignano TaxID=282301 RepID=A0A1I8F851_9PLAT